MAKHAMDAELTRYCSVLSNAAKDRTDLARYWFRIAEGTNDADTRAVALNRGERYQTDARSTQAMRTNLISGDATAIEAAAWLDALEANR